MSNNSEKAKIKLIYNPHAGVKRRRFSLKAPINLEQIQILFERYQIPVDYFPSKSVDDSIQLARDSVKEGYEMVVVAGGDGTVATVAHGLINSNVTLAVLPLGSVMNIARMLAVPNNLEMAIALIKIGKKRKIDVGQITRMDGEKLAEPSYFIEQAGVGFDADNRYYINQFVEKGEWKALFSLLKLLIPLFGPRIEVTIDGKVLEKKARMVIISNGPYSGLGLEFSPTAKLNDHLLTTSVFPLSRFGLAKFLINIFLRKKSNTSKLKIYNAHTVKVDSKSKKMIHADARVFGTTPAEFKIVPGCLNVITGFPAEGTSALNKRTPLDY